MGPCLTRLQKCDEHYEASGLPPHTASVATQYTVPVAAGQKCEMATCLAQVAPMENAQEAEYADANPITGRVANGLAQPGASCTEEDPCDTETMTKGEDQVATVCTKEFMKSHKTKFDLALMQCVQLRARRVEKRPYHELTTTTPGPTPANWYCLPRFSFDAVGVNTAKEVIGPYRTLAAAQAELAEPDLTQNANGRKRRIEQFICEIRDTTKYDNTLPPGHPGAKFPVQQGKVQHDPLNLGNVATRTTDSYKQYTKWKAANTIEEWGTTTQQSPGFNVGCHASNPPSGATPDQLGTGVYPNQGVNSCPDKIEMLDYCQHEKNCNPYNPGDLAFLDPE